MRFRDLNGTLVRLGKLEEKVIDVIVQNVGQLQVFIFCNALFNLHEWAFL